ncbi:hypothetical protein HELRODRAFT_170076 [Helobdella robusta]|uniref:Glycosyltransferase family 92 protein n=1 Tax=Helobdella robusta TaxID=6412 RepID=T1F2L8_HELRO|nr:hypothetical protein HELRODRAFT_170076 [Helobdella robusta]ESO07536.1 hypothetical protein HELRODRAFT_170076 [Helobdella robusta]
MFIEITGHRKNNEKDNLHNNNLKSKRNPLKKNAGRIMDMLLPEQFLNVEKFLDFPVKMYQNNDFVSICDKFLEKPTKLIEDSWESVGNEKSNETFVYAAYVDKRESLYEVKLVAISKGVESYSENVKYCYLWFHDKDKPEIVMVQQRSDNHFDALTRYAGFFFNCHWNDKVATPYAVSLSTKPCSEQKRFFKIKDNSFYMKNSLYNFSVCVTPLHNNYNNVSQLIEMIEINRLFGANHFTFYKHSVGDELQRALNLYEKEGIIDVLNWNLPVNVDPFPEDPRIEIEIHYFAQLAALNDCLYRNFLKYKFIVFSDMDELIVPQLHNSWFEMLRHASAEWSSRNVLLQDVQTFQPIIGSYMLRNVFIPIQWSENTLANYSEFDETTEHLLSIYQINTAFRTYCEKKIYPGYIRSKYIVRSHVTKLVAVHQAMKFINYKNLWQITVEPHTGLLYHFRQWIDNKEGNFKNKCGRLLKFLPKYLNSILEKLKLLES